MVEADLYALMDSHIPEELRRDFQLTIREGLRLRHGSQGDELIGYFGGLPELPDGFDWPGDDRGHYEHVATIDLARLPALDLSLPTSGRITVFGDTHGWSGALLYFADDVVLQKTALPEDLERQNRLFRHAPMTYVTVPTVPSPQWLEEHLLGDDDRDDSVHKRLESFADIFFSHSSSWHQLGGWANEIQGESDRGLLPDTTAEQHFFPDYPPLGPVLIAKFDTDHELGMGWGDFGTLYCFIDIERLEARDFSNVEVHWESY
ncbi:DUF1963 domain-containing protein [Nocardia salmonicida]|uniref:DUF1963 domain-containing protein n=1 Tax=Nocardia salmonicida TaxID=53431 RepID=UPI0037AEB74A